MSTGAYISISLYMASLLLIGFQSYRQTTASLSDYLLGGRKMGPVITALSTGASDMSGWLMMALPGAIYVSGLSSGWIVIGLTAGAYLNWLYVAPRLRTYSEIANDSITIPEYLENRFEDRSHLIRIISALVIFIFFTFYTSSGMVAGGELFVNAFHLDYRWGATLVAGVVVVYSMIGGFPAISITHFVQGTIMIIALILVPVVTMIHLGGVAPMLQTLKTMNPAILDPLIGTSTVGMISLLAWGLGYFGQPHIIIRFMAISSRKKIRQARHIGMSWLVFSILGAMLSGLAGLSYFQIQHFPLDNPNTVFIMLSNILFHPLVAGFLIAAVLAAIMSTISAQLLVTSSAFTQDIYRVFLRKKPSERELIRTARLSLLIISLIALYLAFNPHQTILHLVGYAWAGFGASFGPVILFSLYWKRMTRWGAIGGMIVGALTVVIWDQMERLDAIYEIIPGFIACSLTIILISLFSKPSSNMQDQFDEMVRTS